MVTSKVGDAECSDKQSKENIKKTQRKAIERKTWQSAVLFAHEVLMSERSRISHLLPPQLMN